MTTTGRIYEILNEGPATTDEIAVTLEMGINIVSAFMADLRRRGKVIATPFHDGTTHRDFVNLYSLKEYA